ncbi:MAG: hypothetical protein ATN35_04330 [Epulopiscium sp. Nele67-Bin004]|nr:MAG: hypothetical protein ATN35_04330 [Epulopiscium sp. Nele67-Bin004]
MFISSYIEYKRKDKDISKDCLGAGVCYYSEITKVELYQIYPKKALIDTLIQRLDMEKDRFVYYSTFIEYKILTIRHQIALTLYKENYNIAIKLLKKYASLIDTSNTVYKQFYNYSIINLMKTNIEDDIIPKDINIKNYYLKTIKLTVPDFKERPLKELLLSYFEIYLIINYAELLEIKQQENLYIELLDFLSDKTKEFQSLFIPKIVYNLSEMYLEQNKLNVLLKLCDKAIDCLRDTERFHYLTNILEIKLKIFKLYGRENEEYHKIYVWLNVLIEFYDMYNVDINSDKYILSTLFSIHEVHLVEDVIKNRRIMLGYTQESLAEGICEAKLISRLENKKTKHPNPFILVKLLKKLNLTGDLYSDSTQFVDVQTFVMCDEATQMLARNRHLECRELLIQIEKNLDMKNNVNRQFILHKQISIDWLSNNSVPDQYLDRLVGALHLTLPLENFSNKDKFYFSKIEIIIITLIIKLLNILGRKEEVIKWIEILKVYFNKDEFFSNKLATHVFFSNTIFNVYIANKQFSTATYTQHLLTKNCVEQLYMDDMNGILYNTASNYIKKNDLINSLYKQEEINYCLKMLKTSYIISDIIRHDYGKKLAREYIEKLNPSQHYIQYLFYS